jgi:hypothetical protein
MGYLPNIANTINKVDIDNGTTQTLYKIMAKIREVINDKTVKDGQRKPHVVSNLLLLTCPVTR